MALQGLWSSRRRLGRYGHSSISIERPSIFGPTPGPRVLVRPVTRRKRTLADSRRPPLRYTRIELRERAGRQNYGKGRSQTESKPTYGGLTLKGLV